MKAIWLTDIHLEFLDAFKFEAFLQNLADHTPENTEDISMGMKENKKCLRLHCWNIKYN